MPGRPEGPETGTHLGPEMKKVVFGGSVRAVAFPQANADPPDTTFFILSERTGVVSTSLLRASVGSTEASWEELRGPMTSVRLSRSTRERSRLLVHPRNRSATPPLRCAKPPRAARAKYAKYAKYGRSIGDAAPRLRETPARRPREVCEVCEVWAADRAGGGHVGRGGAPAARARIPPDLNRAGRTATAAAYTPPGSRWPAR
jgi:hypothetical protein